MFANYSDFQNPDFVMPGDEFSYQPQPELLNLPQPQFPSQPQIQMPNPPQPNSGTKKILKRAPQRKLKYSEDQVEKQLKERMDRVGFDAKNCPEYKFLLNQLKLPYVKKEVAYKFAKENIVGRIGVKYIGREYYRTFRGMIFWYHEQYNQILRIFQSDDKNEYAEQETITEINAAQEIPQDNAADGGIAMDPLVLTDSFDEDMFVYDGFSFQM